MRIKNLFLFLMFLTLCSEAYGHVELGHNHTPFYGGQVGMSGNLHIEFVAHQKGDYAIYVTDLLRKPVNVLKATGTLAINSEEKSPETLILSVENPAQGLLVAKGKMRHLGETIVASVEINLAGQEPISVEFQQSLGPRTVQIEKITKVKEYVCKQGHLFLDFQKACPLDGSSIERIDVLKKSHPKITVI